MNSETLKLDAPYVWDPSTDGLLERVNTYLISIGAPACSDKVKLRELLVAIARGDFSALFKTL